MKYTHGQTFINSSAAPKPLPQNPDRPSNSNSNSNNFIVPFDKFAFGAVVGLTHNNNHRQIKHTLKLKLTIKTVIWLHISKSKLVFISVRYTHSLVQSDYASTKDAHALLYKHT